MYNFNDIDAFSIIHLDKNGVSKMPLENLLHLQTIGMNVFSTTFIVYCLINFKNNVECMILKIVNIGIF